MNSLSHSSHTSFDRDSTLKLGDGVCGFAGCVQLLETRRPSPATRKKMATGMGVEVSFLEQLVPLCRGMAPLSPEDQRMIATTLQSERNWALAVQFCEASEKSESPVEALRLAHLGVDLARALDSSPWQLRLLGWCEVFVGAAFRAQGDLEEAQETFDRADEYWTQGAAGDPAGLLDEQRRAAVKAGA